MPRRFAQDEIFLCVVNVTREVEGEVRHDNVSGTFGACFLCNTGRLKLKGAKLKSESTVLRVCVKERESESGLVRS